MCTAFGEIVGHYSIMRLSCTTTPSLVIDKVSHHKKYYRPQSDHVRPGDLGSQQPFLPKDFEGIPRSRNQWDQVWMMLNKVATEQRKIQRKFVSILWRDRLSNLGHQFLCGIFQKFLTVHRLTLNKFLSKLIPCLNDGDRKRKNPINQREKRKRNRNWVKKRS